MESIYDFEQYLDKDKEVALYLTNFGESVLMHITDIGYSNPSLIHYFGYVNGNYAELIQHVSQINFLITSAPKLDDEKPARRIGFKNNVAEEFVEPSKEDLEDYEEHVSQINFLITSAPKLDDEKPARRIGFKNNVAEEFVEPSKEDLEDYEELMKESRTNF